jgi:hypothetical protein
VLPAYARRLSEREESKGLAASETRLAQMSETGLGQLRGTAGISPRYRELCEINQGVVLVGPVTDRTAELQ